MRLYYVGIIHLQNMITKHNILQVYAYNINKCTLSYRIKTNNRLKPIIYIYIYNHYAVDILTMTRLQKQKNVVQVKFTS